MSVVAHIGVLLALASAAAEVVADVLGVRLRRLPSIGRLQSWWLLCLLDQSRLALRLFVLAVGAQ